MASESRPNLPNSLRSIPSVNRLLDHPNLVELAHNHCPAVVNRAARSVLNDLRTLLLPPRNDVTVPKIDVLAAQVVACVENASEPTLRSAINATGIVLHTGLGRSRLHWAAAQALNNVALNHSL